MIQFLVTGKEMKEYDNNTIEYGGISGLDLMENAAKALLEEISLPVHHEKVLIVCGVGNNGGDGLALARMLSDKGCDVKVIIKGNMEKATDSFQHQKSLLDGYKIHWLDADKM